MDEIALDVGLGKASLYYYFPSKENLFQAVVLREQQEFITSIKTMLKGDLSASGRLREYFDQRLDYFNKLLNLNILDLSSSIKMKPAFAGMFQAFAEAELKLLCSIIREGKSSGEFEIHSTEKVARALLHLLQGLRLRYIRSMKELGTQTESQEILHEEVSLVGEIFIRGISGKQALHPRRKEPLYPMHSQPSVFRERT